MHIELEYIAGIDGRPHGSAIADDGEPRSFSGTIQLLRLLDDLVRSAADDRKDAIT